MSKTLTLQPLRAAVGAGITLSLDFATGAAADEVVFNAAPPVPCSASVCPAFTVVVDSSHFKRWYATPATCTPLNPDLCHDKIFVTIPKGAATGRVTVRHSSGSRRAIVSSDVLSIVSAPVISSVMPSMLTWSTDTITIRGRNFAGATVDGASDFEIVSDTLITARMPGGCGGELKISNNGIALQTDTIPTLMHLTSISPSHVKTGSVPAGVTRILGTCILADEIVFTGAAGDIVLPATYDNMYSSPGGSDWIALKNIPAGAISGLVKLRRKVGGRILEAASTDTLFIDSAPTRSLKSDATSKSDAPLSAGEYKISFQGAVVNGKSAGFICAAAEDGKHLGITFGDGVIGAISGKVTRTAPGTYEVRRDGESVNIFSVLMARLDPPAGYTATSGTVTITEWTAKIIRGTFQVTAQSSGEEDNATGHVLRGSFAAVPLVGCN